MYNKKEFAKDFREKLVERRLTQKELAIETGLTEAAISNYLKGERFPNLTCIDKINKALNSDFCRNNYKLNDESITKLSNKSFRKLMKNKDFKTLERLIEIEKQITTLENEKRKLLESI